MKNRYILAVVIFLFSSTIFAATAQYPFPSDIEEKVFTDLTKTLRCAVCENRSLYDSTAPLAMELKKEIYLMVKNGANNKEVMQFMTNKYGEAISYKPKFTHKTWGLWIGPVILLLLGFTVLFKFTKGKVR